MANQLQMMNIKKDIEISSPQEKKKEEFLLWKLRMKIKVQELNQHPVLSDIREIKLKKVKSVRA